MKKTVLASSWLLENNDNIKNLKYVENKFLTKFFKLIKEYKKLNDYDFINDSIKCDLKNAYKKRLCDYYKSIQLVSSIIYNGYNYNRLKVIEICDYSNIIESYLKK